MSKDILFEEMAFAITDAATTPIGIEAGLIQWAPIHRVLVDFCAQADEREAQREADDAEDSDARCAELNRAEKADARCKRLRLRIQVMERLLQNHPSFDPAAEYSRGWAAVVKEGGYTPGGPLGRSPVGPTADAIERVGKQLRRMKYPGHSFGGAVLDALDGLAKRMDATEGDTLNLSEAIKKLEEG